MVASTGLGLGLGEASVDSLDGKPKAHQGALPLFRLNLRYGFASTGTQLFVASGEGNALRFDGFFQGGVQQSLGSAGAVSLAYLYSLPVKVWVDPYVTGVARSETNRRAQGGRLGWERVLGSPLYLQYTFRHVSIDEERSGTLLGLSADGRRLLARGGNVHQGEIRWPFSVAAGHQLTPAFSYTREDLRGAASSANTYEFKLRYAFGGAGPIALQLEGAIGRSVHDRDDPVFGKMQTDLRYATSATARYRAPFGWEPFGYRRWSLFATVGYHAADSGIAFYSASLFIAGAGVAAEF